MPLKKYTAQSVMCEGFRTECIVDWVDWRCPISDVLMTGTSVSVILA